MDQQSVINQLPEPLARKVWMQGIFAAGTGVLSVGAAIAFKDPVALMGLVLTAYLLVSAFSLRHSWYKGKIYEICAVCLAVNDRGMAKNDCQVTFAFSDNNDVVPDDSEAEALTAVVPRKSCDFVEGLSYVLYVKASDMSHIVEHAILNVSN